MKKILLFSCFIILLGCFCIEKACSQDSMEQIKAQARAQARQELGITEVRPQIAERKTEEINPAKTKLEILKQIALIGIIIALIPATIAKLKGRSFIAWWVLGLACFIIVLPISIYMKKLPEKEKKEDT